MKPCQAVYGLMVATLAPLSAGSPRSRTTGVWSLTQVQTPPAAYCGGLLFVGVVHLLTRALCARRQHVGRCTVHRVAPRHLLGTSLQLHGHGIDGSRSR